MAGLLITAAVTSLNPLGDGFVSDALASQTNKIAISSHSSSFRKQTLVKGLLKLWDLKKLAIQFIQR